MTYTIETGFPLPFAGAGRHMVYPLADMKVGDSFFCPNKEGVKRTTVSNAIAAYQRKTPGAKFAVRKVDGGIRVWRTA